MSVNADLDWAIEDVRARFQPYALYRAYDEGNHRLLFATEKYRNAFGDLFREFADNMCEDVVDGITDRLQPLGWSATDRTLNGRADDLWAANQGQARSGAVHRNGFREGDGFSIVQTNRQGNPRIYRQRPEQMAVRYSTDSPDEKELAAKVWKDGRRYRANLYYPDRTERWASRGTGSDGGLPRAAVFSPLAADDPELAGMDEPSAISTHDDGIPVFHYPNGDLSAYGRSILRGVIPLQDAFNKSIADMLVTMEGTAAPIRWARGIEVERDPVTGLERDPFKGTQRPGSVMRTGSKDAMFGQFDAASMDGFLDVQDQFKIEIARKGKLPPHAVTLRGTSASYPSGVSLLVSEGATIKLAKDRQRDWGSEHQAEMAYALRLEMGTRDVSARDLTLEWAPPETRDERALIETLLMKKDLGVPDRQLLLEAGYSSDEADQFEDAVAAVQEGHDAALSVLQGGRAGGVTPGAALALTGALGVPGAPVPPATGRG